MSDRQRLEGYFAEALAAVRGEDVLQHHLTIETTASPARVLRFHRGAIKAQMDLPPTGRLRLIALGKAALSMTVGFLAVLQRERLLALLDAALVIVKESQDKDFINRKVATATAQLGSRWQLMQGGHPIADQRSLQAGRAILDFVADSGRHDRYLVLLSGGASALAVQPIAGVTLSDKSAWVQALMRTGAPIDELNLLRRYLSRLKGGGLARAMAPASHLTLAISDVPGDDPRVIGSAPTLALPASRTAVTAMLDRRRLGELSSRLPRATSRARSRLTPTAVVGAGDSTYAVIATLDDAIEVLVAAGRRENHRVINLGRSFYGEVATHAQAFCQVIREQAAGAGDGISTCLIIAAGEPIIRLEEMIRPEEPGPDPERDRLGGRAQHFALLCARELSNLSGVTVLAAGTDGSDGPTAAAGACVSGDTWAAIKASGRDPQAALDGYRSHSVLARVGALLQTGPTGTNVADLFIALVRR